MLVRSVVTLLLGACAACSHGESRASPPRGVLLVSIDTTRSDRLSAYGYDRSTTPAIEALAARGVRFASAYSPMPTTDPSHTTMLTGLYPRSHGIMRNAARTTDPERPTLATVLRERGYATAAITARLGLDPKLRGIAGFDHADSPRLPAKWRTADEIVALAERWLSAKRGERWFLWVHLWEPHKPYDPIEPWRDRFLDPSTSADAVVEDPPRFVHPGRFVAPAVVQAARSLYDAEVAIADHAVARIVAAARASAGTSGDLLVSIVSDHGEALGERQASRGIAFGHGAMIHDEVVKVPWVIVRESVIEPAIIDGPVSLVDLAATLAQLVDPSAPIVGEGRSLATQVLAGSEPDVVPIVVERRLFATSPQPGLAHPETAWIDYPWKLIVNEGKPTPQLYRLDVDPGELRDVATTEPAQLKRLRGALDAWKQAHPLPEGEEGPVPTRQSEAEMDALRSLGYID